MASPADLLAAVRDIGSDHKRGGYSRHVFDTAEREMREWFHEQATRRDLPVRTDRNGNLWAWWGKPPATSEPKAIVTGSHLDSVPGGGQFDGPLGVVSAFSAIDQLWSTGYTPRHPMAVVAFAEEEGGRFGVPCLGSRLLTGTIDPETARALRDVDGITFGEAADGFGLAPERIGPDADTLRGVGCFVELHIEQGRGLVDLERPVAVASSILAHGRWRFRFSGQGNHAGATPIADRRDPMVPSARFVVAVRQAAARRDRINTPARATVGRLTANPGGTNVIPSTVDVWLDARSVRNSSTHALVDELTRSAETFAEQEGCSVRVIPESYGARVEFDKPLADELSALLSDAPLLATGAGHDAGILAAQVPTAMLFVRNPTGVSHAPEEHAESEDCVTGADALARVLRQLDTKGCGGDDALLV